MTAHRHRAFLTRAAAALAPALIALSIWTPTASAAVPEWTTYRHDAARSGVDPYATLPLAPTQAWQSATLDGRVYAEPLVYGPRVYVATENDTIYALDAATGTVAWERHLATPVPGSQLPCGDIEPVVGITSTPVIEPASQTIYAVIDRWDGVDAESIRHELVALDLGTGAMRPGFPIDVDPPFPAGGGSAQQQLQRAALALDGNEIVIGYGGNDGDCGTYWGWLVAAATDGAGPLRSYQVDSRPGHDEGAIWGAGNGPPVDSSGDVYVATGNGSSGSEYDYGDSVLKLDPNLELLDSWSPADWQQLDEHDADLGSSEPVPLPGGVLFEIGKQGVGVLLEADGLGGVGAAPLAELPICGGSWGGGIYVPASAATGTLYVTCTGGLRAVSVTGLTDGEPELSLDPHWMVDKGTVGPPIFAGGLVWVASWQGAAGRLFGLDPGDGAVSFESKLGTFEHFSTPSAAGGRLYVANGTQVTSFTIATPPAPSPTTTVLAASVDPAAVGQPVTFTAVVGHAPDAGTVAFTDGGVTIAGCGAVEVSRSTGTASCQAAFGQPGTHAILASYSGDPYYGASSSSPLAELVGAATPAGSLIASPSVRPVLADLRQAHAVWREGPQPARVSGRKHPRPPVGTTFSFTLNEAARVTFRFTVNRPGRLVGRGCRAPTRGNRRQRRCTYAVTAGFFSFTGHRGLNVVAFQGRIGRAQKLLPGGRYALIVTAGDAAGASSSMALGFTIVA